MSQKKLYVVVPYFNHTNAAVNRANLHACLKNLACYEHSEVVLVEGVWNKEAELEDYSKFIFKHLKYELSNPIWVKENLINLGIHSLNSEWDFVCWLDKDIHFLNPNWDSDTINKLKKYDIIQPWTRLQFLNERYEIDIIPETGEGSLFIKNHYKCPDLEKPKGFLSYAKAFELGYALSGHPGHAWAINKKLYTKMGGLFDRCIVGGGDSLLTTAIDETFYTNNFKLHDLYGMHYQKYVDNLRGTKVGYVEGTIVHHQHGKLINRNYYKRYNILLNNIDLEKDISYSDNGTIRINNPDVERNILDYFHSRKEHI